MKITDLIVTLHEREPVLATWDIRSWNRYIAHDGTGLLAAACERRVQ